VLPVCGPHNLSYKVLICVPINLGVLQLVPGLRISGAVPPSFFLFTGQFYICLQYRVAEISGHSCTLATSALQNLPLNPSNKRLCGPQTSGRFARETDLLHLPRNKPRFIGRKFHRQDSVSKYKVVQI